MDTNRWNIALQLLTLWFALIGFEHVLRVLRITTKRVLRKMRQRADRNEL